MNLAYALRRALRDCVLVRPNGTTPINITEQLMVSWAQDAIDQMTKLWHKSGADYNLTTRESTDAAFTFMGETYNPSSFQLTTTTLDYTLPPDFIKMKRIRATNSSFKNFVFTAMDIDHNVFRGLNQSFEADANPGGQELYYDIIGRRTIHFSHAMPQASDIEIIYEARLPKLFIYGGRSSNTAALVNGDATVDTSGGTASEFLAEALSTPAHILFASDGDTVHPQIVTQTAGEITVEPGATGIGQGFPIDSFTTDTSLELTQTWPFASDANIGYLIASAPDFFLEHQELIIRYIRHLLYDAVGNAKASDRQLAFWDKGKTRFEYDIKRRVEELQMVEDWEG